MATTSLHGNTVQTVGDLPTAGDAVPSFTLTNVDLSDRSDADIKGGRTVLNIFPSIDTPVCQASVRHFNKSAADVPGVTVLNVSNDLPFALSRFCGAEGIESVENASGFRSDFGDVFGVTMTDGPLRGLLARAIVVVDEAGQVLHSQLVDDIGSEPDYDAALTAVKA